jgi:hypothetical protein
LDWNAYYECFVLHARNLYLFLTNGDGANAKATRFIKGGFESDKTEDTISVFQKLGTQVFHLGIKRPSEQKAKVTLDNAETVNQWVEENFKSFLEKLNDHDVLGDRTPSWPELQANPKQVSVQTFVFGALGTSATNHIIIEQTNNFTR